MTRARAAQHVSRHQRATKTDRTLIVVVLAIYGYIIARGMGWL